MAFPGMGSNGSGGRGRRRWGGASLSEMNVVPLVDVVLVLLIIFMITASAMEFGLEVEVPKVKQTRNTVEERPVVTIDRRSNLFLNDQKVNINLLGQQVKQRFPEDKEVYLKADRTVAWEQVAQVMSVLGEAGLGLKAVTQTEEIREKGR